MRINKYIIAISTILFISIGGCKKELDINTDPNNAADVDVNLLLPYSQASIAFATGNTLQIYGSIWSQYWTQNPASSQYRSLEQYNPSASDFNNVWANLNSDALEDLQRIIDKSKGNAKKQQYEAIATLLKAYTVQLSTDLFGDIPYSEALKGDKGILSPKFDKQEVIYDSLVVLIDRGISLIDLSSEDVPSADDLVYGDPTADTGEVMAKWLRFAYTLKLKVALRLAYVNEAKAANIISTLNQADVEFIRSGESAQIKYQDVGGGQNPLLSAIGGPVLTGTQNLVASNTTTSFFNNYGDPRVAAFYNAAATGYVGIDQGNYAGVTPGTPIATPSAAVGADASTAAQTSLSAVAPVKLMTDYEAKFLQAEAIARGWLPGDAAEVYKAGIEDSFVAYEIDPEDIYGDGTDVTTFEDFYEQEGIALPTSGKEEIIEAIITQKWAAMCGNQGIEAWIEWRRTGYPSFFTLSKASIIGAGRFPQILLYPTDETTRNSNAPAQHQIYDRVWWDVR